MNFETSGFWTFSPSSLLSLSVLDTLSVPV